MEGGAVKILLADDDRVTRRLMESQLRRWGYKVMEAVDGEEALEILARPDGPRLAVLDWMMPKLDGAEVCRRLRAVGREDYVYVILLTSKNRKEDLAAGLEAGADDYVAKPFDHVELRARLRVGERMVGFSQGLLSANAMLRTLALTDELTGLLNHGAILARLREEHGRTSRTGLPLGVLMADVDHFKSVNDSLGHAAGDLVLKRVARAIRAACRPYDVVGRYGGEEFLVLMPVTDGPHALAVAERIRAAVASWPVSEGNRELRVTISLGVSVLGGATPPSPEAVLEAADRALYRAKNDGRDRVCSSGLGLHEAPDAGHEGSGTV